MAEKVAGVGQLVVVVEWAFAVVDVDAEGMNIAGIDEGIAEVVLDVAGALQGTDVPGVVDMLAVNKHD